MSDVRARVQQLRHRRKMNNSFEDGERRYSPLQANNIRGAWWVYAVDQGKPVLLGGFGSQTEADREGYTNLSVPFKTIHLPTINRSAASAMIKERRLDETHNLRESLKPIRHKMQSRKEAGL